MKVECNYAFHLVHLLLLLLLMEMSQNEISTVNLVGKLRH